MRRVSSTFVLALVCAAPAVSAGPVVEVEFAGQPIQFTKQGAIDGCGVRLVGVTSPASAVSSVQVIDVSFNVANPGGGIVKGGLMTMPAKALIAGKLDGAVEVPIKGLWLKAPGEVATHPVDDKFRRTTTHKHSLMYATSLAPVMALVTAFEEGKPVQVGFRVSSKDMEHVFFGKIAMTEAERAQFEQCYMEWTDGLLKKLKERKQ